MQSVSNDTFGPLIAYLVPGATALAGISLFSDTLRTWFASSPTGSPTIGGFLYLTLASLAAGMTVSAIRWALLDTLHRWTGLRPPPLNFAHLGRNLDAFALLIEIHYKHYLFYSNMFVAVAIAFTGYRVSRGWGEAPGWSDLGFVLLEMVLFAASRDTLRKYYARSQQVLPPPTRRGR